jgi:hypothetical protein
MPARRLLPLALTALMLTACSPDDTLIDSPSSPPASPTAAETVAQPIELGDFDPDGDFEVFNPCTEIPAEVRAAAGLGEPVRETAYDGDRSVRCAFYPTDTSLRGTYALTGDKVSFNRIEERGLLLNTSAKSAIPGAYLHQMGTGAEHDCNAAVHTTRGRFIVQYNEISAESDRAARCVLALEKLEDIYHHLGESNGDVDRS